MIETLQKQIDQTEYWDLKILDFQINYFGDEVTIIVYDDEIETSWKISFLICHSVTYETDASWNWRKGTQYVREMKRNQLGYYGQDITLSENKEIEGFYNVSIHLSIFTAQVVCKEVTVEKISNSSWDFFWEKN